MVGPPDSLVCFWHRFIGVRKPASVVSLLHNNGGDVPMTRVGPIRMGKLAFRYKLRVHCFYWDMGFLRCLFMTILISLPYFSEGRELRFESLHNSSVYNRTLAKTLVEYASAVYMSDLTALFTWTCTRCTDMTEGFEMIEIVVDVQHCLQAYVGVAQDLNAIVIAFRGTQENSLQNWIQDLFWKQLDLKYSDMPDAMVHHGFYSAYHNTTIRPGVVNAVQRAWELYGRIGVMVTGHSMGGAMASFCALDLKVNYGANIIQLMTFGQPRIGNSIFASYFGKHIPATFRIIHEHDIVPHLPPFYTRFPKKTYHHFPQEVWLYTVVMESLVYKVEKVCDISGEDPSCSRSVPGNSIADHWHYYGVDLEAETWGSCKIVTDDSMITKDGSEISTNFIISRDGPLIVLKNSLLDSYSLRSAL